MLKFIWKLFETLLSFRQVKRAARKFPVSAHKVSYASASIVGTFHANGSKPNEDAHCVISQDGKYAFCVVDGAGGESNGQLASRAVVQTLESMLPGMLANWNDAEQALIGLKTVCELANDEAQKVAGMATLIVFVSFPSGEWALLRVGDAVFVGLDSDGKWQLPIQPIKFTLKRNVTSLLGGDPDIDNLSPVYASAKKPFAMFLLGSDWLCGSEPNAVVLDTTPSEYLGSYIANHATLDLLAELLYKKGSLCSPSEIEACMLSIQTGQIGIVQFSKDDMTLIFGVVED